MLEQEFGTRADPFEALRWENLLDDLNDAHNKLDAHLELSDEWLHDFEGRMRIHVKVSMLMYHTINDLKQTIKTQQMQIEDLQTVIRQWKYRPIITSLDQTSAKI
jgi:nucleosome binding factor SPN SPT16 subunit